MLRTYTVITCVLLLTLIPAGMALGQDQQLEERVTVRERLTDVVVTDSQGIFIPGLGAENFRVLINGEVVEVTNVEEVGTFLPTDKEIQEYKAALERGESPSLPSPPRNIVFVIDRYNLGALSMKETKDSIRYMLDSVLLPYDNVTLAEYNRKLRILVQPTSDHEKVKKALDELGGYTLNENYIPQANDFFLPKNPRDLPDLNLHLAQKEVDIQNYFSSMRALVEAMEALPGKKTFLLYSDGPNVFNPAAPENLPAEAQFLAETMAVSQEPGSDAPSLQYMSSPEERREAARQLRTQLAQTGLTLRSTVQREFKRLEENVTLNNGVIYTIRRGSLNPEWVNTAELSSVNIYDTRGMGRVEDINLNTQLNAIKQIREDFLRETASRTSGKYYDAALTDERLGEELAGEIGNYYMLSIRIPERIEGDTFDMKVEVVDTDEQELEIGYREEIALNQQFATRMPPESINQRQFVTSMVTAPASNDLDLENEVFLLPFRDRNTAAFVYDIDAAKLEADEEGRYELQMMTQVKDEQGLVVFEDHQLLTGKIEKGAERLWFSGYIPFKPEGSQYNLILRDNVSGRMSNASRYFQTTVPGGEKPYLTKPILMRGPRQEGNLGNWEAKELPLTTDIEEPMKFLAFKLPGVPLHENEFIQGESVNVMFMIGNIPEGSTDKAETMEVAFYLRDEEGGRYRLLEEQPRVQYVDQYNTIIYAARLPIGLAQVEKGALRIEISNFYRDETLSALVPYSIRNFDAETAAELAKEGNIISVKLN